MIKSFLNLTIRNNFEINDIIYWSTPVSLAHAFKRHLRMLGVS